MKPYPTHISYLKPFALALALCAGSTLAQTIHVGGAGVIGDSTLTTVTGVAKLPDTGANWTAAGGNGPTFSSLVSPTVTVTTTGATTLTFTHRYNFETDATGNWDGGAVYVSVNGETFTKVPLASFTTNGYNGTAVASVWLVGEEIFAGQSAGWSTPTLITSVANLGNLTAGDTVAVDFRGAWDGNTYPAAPNWEIGTANIADTGATLLNVNFAAAGKAGFTASATGNGASPWIYQMPLSKFEIDATTTPRTADRYKPDVAGSVIDISGANIEVVLLNGTPSSGDVFSLFDLTGGTTLTGSINSISLPPGIWDTSSLATAGTITLTTAFTPADGTWITDANGTWSNPANWGSGTLAYGTDHTAFLTQNITAARVVTLDANIIIGNITFTDSTTSSHDLTISGAKTLTLDVTTGKPVIDVTQTNRTLTISSVITGSDGLKKSGIGILNLTGANTYTGTTVANGGVLNFATANMDGFGGGPGSRDISVSAGQMVQRTASALNAAFLKRMVETNDEFVVCSAASGASDVGTGNTLDFSSSSNGANLPNAFFGSFATNGGQCRYNGTIIPASDNYRIGFPGTNGALSMIQPLVDIGAPSTPRGLIIGGATPVLAADNTFTGDTVLRSGRLFLGRQLALQNSALNVGNGSDGIAGQICFLLNNTGGATQSQLTDQPTLGGLIGSRNLATIYNSANQNNTTRLAITAVLGLTLDVDSGKTHTYAGNVRLATGMYLTKTGPGTQVLSGANDYTGATSVNQGTLALVGGSHKSPITVAVGASLGFTLASPTISTSSVNLTNGTVKITGSVDNATDYLLMTASTIIGTPALDAPITGYQLQKANGDTELKLVKTVIANPYATWSGGAAANIDTNGDGVANGAAWALGAAGPNANATGLLPTLDNTSDPTYVIFKFNRSDAANEDPKTAIAVEYGSDLVGWTTAVDNDDVDILVTPGSPHDAVEVKLKRSTLGASGKIFARLKVVVTTP